jgi:molecular chaperone DnaK (HSP70)
MVGEEKKVLDKEKEKITKNENAAWVEGEASEELKEGNLVIEVKVSQDSNGKVKINMEAFAYDEFTDKVFITYGDEHEDRVRKYREDEEKYESADVSKDEHLSDKAIFYCKKSKLFETISIIINEIRENREKVRKNKIENFKRTYLI